MEKFTLTITTQAVDLISSMFDDIGIEGIGNRRRQCAPDREGDKGDVY